jgi:hypothetical protein
MAQATLQNAPDLQKGFPRSPNALVGDYVLLGRILDKCRATIAGMNGEYNYNCPLDRRFFDFTGVDAEAFKAFVAEGKSDEEVLAWVKSNSTAKTQEEILAWAYESRWAAPTEPQMRAYYEKLRREVAPERPFLQSWFQLLDAEEGRF